MAIRAYWKGHLRLSLVTIGVEAFAATESQAKAVLHQIHKPSGRRVRYEKIAEGEGPIANEDIVKGVEVGDGAYVVLEPEEIDSIKLESKKTIELVQFVKRDEVDPRFYEQPFYLAPDSEMSKEGYSVIREALAKADRIGLGKMTLRGRESLVAIGAFGEGLLLETLRYAAEVRAPDQVFAGIGAIKTDPEMVSLASELIARKSGRFDPAAFHDEYEHALQALIARKRAGNAIVTGVEDERAPRGGQVIDLMQALRRSIETGPAPKPAAKSRQAAAPAPAPKKRTRR